MKILHITTVPMSLTFLRGQVGYMKERGCSLHAISSPGEDLDAFGSSEGIPVQAVSMTRQITPVRDLLAVLRIRRTLRKVRPTIVHSHTPKGGLLGMIAAASARVPVRIYQMRGLPFMTATGPRRHVLKLTERVSCSLADAVYCNSHSMRDIVIDEGICAPEKAKVLLGGSGNGVDAAVRFNPDTMPPSIRHETRLELGIPPEATVIGFVGRIVREKGIAELEEAWRVLRDECPSTHLLIVGPFETQDLVPANVVARLQNDRRVHMTGLEWNTPPLYAAMDLVVLPTYREGFPNVPLEAAAMKLPVVATNVAGCVDAVLHGRTGLLVPARDSHALTEALRMYLDDIDLRMAHGNAGRERVLREFRQDALWEALHGQYDRLLGERGRMRPVPWEKRGFDLIFSLLALLLLSLPLAALALLVRVRMGHPVLFKQTRPGRGGRPFVIYKFRTMGDAKNQSGEPLPDEYRLTKLGRFLRRTSLDELPELLNVIKGEMSLVGPRPLLMDYLPLYSPMQARRHEVQPGITGWAQVHGRNATTWETRLELDVWYVENRSMWLDIRILLRTLKTVVLREGINQEGAATMRRFRGSPV